MTRMRSASTRNLDQYRELYRNNQSYGKSSEELAETLISLIADKKSADENWEPHTILDFGCGLSNVAEQVGEVLGLAAYKYDPAISSLSVLPVKNTDIVINTDVLEHLDIDEIEDMLSDIREISPTAIFHIATNKASAHLPNGENAHATVMSVEEWRGKLSEHFERVFVLPAKKSRGLFITWEPRQRVVLKLRWTVLRDRIKKKVQRFSLG